MSKTTEAELVDIKDPVTDETKIYIRFVGGAYKDKERFILISPDEFDALVKLFVDKIVSKAKEKDDQSDSGVKANSEGDKSISKGL